MVKIWIDEERKALEPYAWPGGYPVIYLARDGWRDKETGKLTDTARDRGEYSCCAKCAADTAQWPDMIVLARDVHYEGAPEECEWCNGLTESAYGDPEEGENKV